MKIKSKNDVLSGIKTVKYDYGDFVTPNTDSNGYTDNNAIKKHFEVNGVRATDDIIFIKEGYDKITVYVEDNAGNIYAEVVDCTLN